MEESKQQHEGSKRKGKGREGESRTKTIDHQPRKQERDRERANKRKRRSTGCVTEAASYAPRNHQGSNRRCWCIDINESAPLMTDNQQAERRGLSKRSIAKSKRCARPMTAQRLDWQCGGRLVQSPVSLGADRETRKNWRNPKPPEAHRSHRSQEDCSVPHFS